MSNNLDFNVFVVVVLLEDCRQLRKESRGTPPLLLLSFFPPQRFVTFLSRGGRVLLSSVYSYYTCVWFSVIICRHFFVTPYLARIICRRLQACIPAMLESLNCQKT